MKPYFLLFSLILSLTLQVPAFAKSLPNTPPPGRYCNPRYDFCLEYPEKVFTEKHSSSNDDGLVLMSADGDVRMRVSGYYNVMGWSAAEEMEDLKTVLRERYGNKLELIAQHNTPEGIEVTFKADYITIYCFITTHHENFVVLEIETNLQKKFNPSHALPLLLNDIKLSHSHNE